MAEIDETSPVSDDTPDIVEKARVLRLCSTMHAAIMGDDLRMVRSCVEEGIDVNGLYYNERPLWFAVFFDRNDIVEFLLQRGADVDLPGRYGETPLIRAVYEENPKMVEILI